MIAFLFLDLQESSGKITGIEYTINNDSTKYVAAVDYQVYFLFQHEE